MRVFPRKALALFPAVALAWGLAAPASAQTVSLTQGCPICDCNDQQATCRMNCTSSNGYASLVSCDATCTKTFSVCVDQAYQTIRAQQQAQQAQTTTTTTATGAATTTTGAAASGS